MDLLKKLKMDSYPNFRKMCDFVIDNTPKPETQYFFSEKRKMII